MFAFADRGIWHFDYFFEKKTICAKLLKVRA